VIQNFGWMTSVDEPSWETGCGCMTTLNLSCKNRTLYRVWQANFLFYMNMPHPVASGVMNFLEHGK
jgi:hypothetical protein